MPVGFHIPKIRVGIGQASHRFHGENSSKLCIVGGVLFEDVPGLVDDSDADVIFHAICNAISSLTGVPILGGIALELYKKDGITDSQIYLQKGLDILNPQRISHVALTLEGKRPKFHPYLDKIRENVARVLDLQLSEIGLTAISGEGLTDFGCGDGLQCFCILTTEE